MADSRDTEVFETALRNAKQSLAAWPTQYCDDIDLSTMHDFDREIQQKIRELMVSSGEPDRRLFLLEDESARDRVFARQLLNTGDVAAIDGTAALEQLTLMSTSAYAVAVGFLTSTRRGDPHISITTTNTRYLQNREVHPATNDELAQLCDQLDKSSISESWPTTFREYHERVMAMTCGTSIVLIDGPVWTQNLMSQSSGRLLYREMDKSPSSFIGVIKNIAGSWTLSKWCGYSLQPGEGFIVGKVKAQFHQRFRRHSEVGRWIHEMPDDYVRVVYRPRHKAFAFECRLSTLPLTVAILLEDASPTINHEIPLLLELIDSQIRAAFHADLARDLVASQMQTMNYQMGVDLTHERTYR